MKRSLRTRIIGGAALPIVLLLGLAIPFVASVPSRDASAQSKRHREHHHPTPPSHPKPTPQPTPPSPQADIVALPNPVIVSSDGTARAYFVLVGNGLTPNHTYSLSTTAVCSLPALAPNSAIADLNGHIQVSAQFYYCVPGTYYVTAADSQSGQTYSTSITLLPPMVSLPSTVKNVKSKR
jgi:hypothetical protein